MHCIHLIPTSTIKFREPHLNSQLENVTIFGSDLITWFPQGLLRAEELIGPLSW